MLRRIGLLAAAVAMVCSAALCQELSDPNKIIDEATEKMMALDNYAFVLEKEGWDFHMEETAEATAQLTGEAAGNAMTQAFTKDVDEVEAEGPEWMTYASEVKFKKPWIVWMRIMRSDYVPDLLINAVMKYNYEKSKDKFAIRAIGLQLARGTDTESGNFLYSNYTSDLIDINLLADQVEPKLDGVVELEDMDGLKAYKIEFDLKDKKLEMKDVNLSEWGVPEELHFKVKPEINWYAREIGEGHIAKAYYYFDADTLALVKQEVFQPDGELYFRKWWRDRKLDNLTPRDFR